MAFRDYMGDVFIHDFAGDVNPHQAGEVALNLVAQAAQGVGATFINPQAQFFEGDIHFAAGGDLAQWLGETVFEFSGGVHIQRLAYRVAEFVGGADIGAVFFVFCLGCHHGNEYKTQGVEADGDECDFAPVLNAYGNRPVIKGQGHKFKAGEHRE